MIGTPQPISEGARVVVRIEAFTATAIDDFRTGHVVCRLGPTDALHRIHATPEPGHGLTAAWIDPVYVQEVIGEDEDWLEPRPAEVGSFMGGRKRDPWNKNLKLKREVAREYLLED